MLSVTLYAYGLAETMRIVVPSLPGWSLQVIAAGIVVLLSLLYTTPLVPVDLLANLDEYINIPIVLAVVFLTSQRRNKSAVGTSPLIEELA